MIAAAIAGGYFGAKFLSGQSGLHPLGRAKSGQKRVACVGDSITYGHGTKPWPFYTYPTGLQKLLGDGYHVNNFGFNGKTVNPDCADAYTATKLYTRSKAYGADILVFMMGTNDAKPRNWRGEEAFRRDLTALLDSYGAKKCVLCTPAVAFRKDGVTEGLAEYEICPETVEHVAQIVRETAARRGCILVDIQTLTRDHPQWYIADRIHPGNIGARQIAGAVAQAILRSESE